MPTALANFRAQLARVVSALRLDGATQDVERVSRRHVRAVTATEVGTRRDSLHDSCELLMGGFEHLDLLMETYVQEVPLASETAISDAERFLEWLATRVDLTDEQVDAIVCQQSRYTVEFVAVKQRLAHARFQEMLSNNRRLLKDLGKNRSITVHLNPVHVWATLETRVYIEESTTIPATVLFYPVADKVEGAVVEADIVPLLQHLNRRAYRVDQLRSAVPHYDRNDLLDIVTELAHLGIVALG